MPFEDEAGGTFKHPLTAPAAVGDVWAGWSAAYMIDSVRATSNPADVAKLAPGRDFKRMYAERTLPLLYHYS